MYELRSHMHQRQISLGSLIFKGLFWMLGAAAFLAVLPFCGRRQLESGHMVFFPTQADVLRSQVNEVL